MNVFNESMCQILLPGLTRSCEYLVKLVRNEKGQSSEMGIAISGAVLCAHTAELLLKYKLDQEGKTFKQIHDLHKLYLLLSNESKEEIQKEFDGLVSQALLPPNGLPTGWDSAEGVFKSACCISTEWRYVIEKNPKSRKSPVFSLDSLYTAVLSVLRTTTLGSAMQTRENMKVEDIPDPDIKARALRAMNKKETAP